MSVSGQMETVGMEIFQGAHRSVSDHPLGFCFLGRSRPLVAVKAAGFYNYHDWEAVDFETYPVAGARAS